MENLSVILSGGTEGPLEMESHFLRVATAARTRCGWICGFGRGLGVGKRCFLTRRTTTNPIRWHAYDDDGDDGDDYAC